MGRRHGEFHISGKKVRWILAAVLLLTRSVTLGDQEAPTDERTSCRNAGFQPTPVGSLAAPACAGWKPALRLGAAQSPASAQAPRSQPSPQNQSSSQQQPSLPLPKQVTASPRNESNIIGFLPPFLTRKKLTPKDKFEIYFHQNYGPQNFILPAAGAAFFMVNPPPHFPRDWKDGGGAFGRWYGEQVVAASANRTGALLAQLAWHEDPRYLPSSSKNVLMRTFHAVSFTLVDKSDSGRDTFALSSLAGAAAGGFTGMAFLPDGYSGVRHAEQRALRGLATVAIRNITTEFRPQWAPILRRVRVPSILPEWWTRRPPQQP
jgi:hypothetical protein